VSSGELMLESIKLMFTGPIFKIEGVIANTHSLHIVVQNIYPANLDLSHLSLGTSRPLLSLIS
jgi:hypothetical protein